MLHNHVVEKIKQQFLGSQFFFGNPAIEGTVEKKYSPAGNSWRYGT